MEKPEKWCFDTDEMCRSNKCGNNKCPSFKYYKKQNIMSKNKICQFCFEVEVMPGLNFCEECEKVMNPKYKFTRVCPESGDWEAWYMNGKLIVEGHRVRADDLLDAIAEEFPNTVKYIEISDEKAEMGFEENLEDMI